MEMHHPAILTILAAILLPGCRTIGHYPVRQPPSLVTPREQPTPPAKVGPPKYGRIGYGILATHYDRDGDGIFEEARRSTTVYHDRNRDGTADLVVEDDTFPFTLLKWDKDFDGVLDDSIISAQGAAHEWQDHKQIIEPAPQILGQDRLQRIEKNELGKRSSEFWEGLLGLEPAGKIAND